jgi:hypothetical protein
VFLIGYTGTFPPTQKAAEEIFGDAKQEITSCLDPRPEAVGQA